MNILFLVSRYPENENESILEKDLVKIFNDKNHNCFVATINERKFNKPTYLLNDNKIKVLKTKTGNMFNDINFIEKGITVVTLPFLLKRSILKHFGNEKIDLIIAYSPFMSNPSLLKPLRKHFLKNNKNLKTMMILWDIFPQNAKDLGIMKNKLIFSYFKSKEHKMLKSYDFIACNSEGNINYLTTNYNFIKNDNLLLVRNCEYPVTPNLLPKDDVRKKYNLKENEIVFIFGGNMGIPQKIENIINIANEFKTNENVKFLFAGNGTEKNKLKQLSKDNKNIVFLDFIPREEYESLINACDIGIISLNEKYTVPNFPAKVTGYCKLGLPILASLDNAAFCDLGVLLKEKKMGFPFKAGNLNEGIELIKKILNKKYNISEYSKNIQEFYNKELNIENAYNNIISKLF